MLPFLSGDVGLCMATKGFAYEHDYNRQEQLMKRLILCQFLAALKLLRTGGSFACKIFDMYTSFGASMFFVIASSFKDVCIVKPLASRPASSERLAVVICSLSYLLALFLSVLLAFRFLYLLFFFLCCCYLLLYIPLSLLA
jgi:succinate-acetate transporter protein